MQTPWPESISEVFLCCTTFDARFTPKIQSNTAVWLPRTALDVFLLYHPGRGCARGVSKKLSRARSDARFGRVLSDDSSAA